MIDVSSVEALRGKRGRDREDSRVGMVISGWKTWRFLASCVARDIDARCAEE